MFNTISWQEFLSAISLIAGGYYVIAALLLYGGEITNILKQSQSKQIHSEVSEDQNDSNEVNDLMGEVKNERDVPHEIMIGPEDISVLPNQEPEEPITQSITAQPEAVVVSAVAGLLQEVNTLVASFENSDKEEVKLLFQHLLSRYPQLLQTTYHEAITFSIANSLQEKSEMQFDLNEIKSWWPELVNTVTEVISK